LKAALDAENAARVIAQVKANVLSRAVRDLKVSANRFTTQIPTLENKVKHLEARGLCLERSTQANNNYQKGVDQLTKKLESKSPDCVKKSIILGLLLAIPALTHRI
jgi:hypothetical protein